MIFLTGCEKVVEFKLWLRNLDKEIEVDKKRIFIGRFYTCDICLKSSSISRIHAEIFMKDDTWYIRDLESKNGTWLNGKRLSAWEEAPIHDNDIISICHNKEVIYFNKSDDESLLEYSLVNLISNFKNSSSNGEVAFDLIIHTLIHTPMYILLTDYENQENLKIGDIDFSNNDDLKQNTFRMLNAKLIPLFTSVERVNLSGTFVKLEPEKWIKFIARSKETAVINPFQEERFILPYMFVLIGILPLLD